jgi:hypothetical protein
LWPDAPEYLWDHVKREELTVGALRAKAMAKGVDTSPKTSGGARPLADKRPITSGDIMAMMKDQADARETEAA